MFLVFKRYGVKWYAQTPAGEYAFSPTRGLYEWRNGNRIDHGGAGDQQGSSNGKMWTSTGYGRPFEQTPPGRGLIEAISDERLNN